jgi:hypothetical protein
MPLHATAATVTLEEFDALIAERDALTSAL